MAEMTAVQRREQEQQAIVTQRKKSAWDMLKEMKGGIANVLPKHMTPDRMAMIAYTAMQKNPKLLECSRESLIGSIMTAAMLGLEPSGPLGHGALIPYWNNRRRGGAGLECQFQPMYQGLLDLARRSGFIQDVQLRAVYKGDTYHYRFGLDPIIEHVPMEGEGADAPDREVTHVYAIIRLIGGGVQWDQMSWAQGMAHGKRYSPSWDPTLNGGKGAFKGGSVWADNPLPMVLKTILKIVLKLCPKSPELSAALLQDDGADMGKTTTMHKFDENVFDVDFGDEDDGKPNGRESGTVSAADLKPGEEQNRGHGKENLASAAGKPAKTDTKTAKSETKSPETGASEAKYETKSPPAETKSDPPAGTSTATADPLAVTDPEAPYNAAQREYLESKRLGLSIDPTLWLNWAKKTFDVKMTSKLPQKTFERAKAWTDNGGKEATDGQ
jgi:recombination protein RecT